MGLLNRRAFIGKGLATAAGAGVVGRTLIEPDNHLENHYRRTEPPEVEVSYPDEWFLYERLVTDLVTPAQLFAVSSFDIGSHASRDESGVPDLTRLPSTEALVWAIAGQTTPQTKPPEAVTVSSRTSLRLDELPEIDDDGWPQFEIRGAWLATSRYVYWVKTWIGKAGTERAMTSDVIGSIRLV